MASKSTKSKKQLKQKSRPVGTTALSEPIIAEASAFASFSCFSTTSQLFAHVSLAVDKHRLRVFDSDSGKAVAETVFQNSRVSAVHWTSLPSDAHDGFTDAEANDDGASRKRKKRKSISGKENAVEEYLVVGFSNGSLAIFSPRQGEIIRTLSSPTSTSPILSITSQTEAPRTSTLLWTSSTGGSIYSWDGISGKLVSTWRPDASTTNYTAISLKPLASEAQSSARILAAHHRIQVLGSSSANSTVNVVSSREFASVTGHASPVVSLGWAAPSTSPSPSSSNTFISAAEGDRFACIWQIPAEGEDEEDESEDEDEIPEGTLIASIPFDTDVRSVGYAHASHAPLAFGLSSSGVLRIFTPPTELATTAKGKREPVTSVIGSSISTSSGAPPIIAISFDPQRQGSVRVARLATGIRPVFDRLEFLSKDGSFVPEIKLKAPAAGQMADSTDDKVLPTKRYKEGDDLTVRSGAEVVPIPVDDLAATTQDGTLDTTLADLSLGERLAASKDGAGTTTIDHATTGTGGSSAAPFILRADAPTMMRTLTQALHSNDLPLLESVLANSGKQLILHTVRRLQPQYAVPLVMACVERINRGARANQAKGRGGGASAQRAELMIRWIRAVLVVHTAHLMTIPDLVSRLAALHTTLTQRLSLQDRLLSLNGRLDLVLAQIENQAQPPPPVVSALPPPTSAGARRKRATKEKRRLLGTKYVEGESSDEDADAAKLKRKQKKQDAMDVDGSDEDEDDDEDEAEETDEEDEDDSEDEGSVEEIELGGEDSDADTGSAEDDDEDEDDDAEPHTNGLLDLEADESSGEEDSGSDESDE